MCTITKIYKDQLQKSTNRDIEIISNSGLIDGRGRDAFSVTTFSNSNVVSIIRTRSYDDAVLAVKNGLDSQSVSKIVIYSRAKPETEIELDVDDIQPIILQDGGCMFHHGVINTINKLTVPDEIVDTLYLAKMYNDSKQKLSCFELSPNNLVLIEYPGDIANQAIKKLAWYTFDYRSRCINNIYTNISESRGEPLWLK